MLEDEIRVFNEHYSRYDAWYLNNLNISLSEKLCIEVLAPYGVVLDIGVGTGFITAGLSRTMIGLDPAEKPLRIAGERGFLPLNAYGDELPFRDDAFDTVLVIVTLCFVNNPLILLLEAYRVSKEGGKLITCIVPRTSVWGKYYFSRKLRGESIFYKYARLYNLEEVEEMICHAGFRIKRYCSTLTYDPYTPPYVEYPKLERNEEAGFICIEAIKE